MEFKEFPNFKEDNFDIKSNNPEENDYDIKSSFLDNTLKTDETNNKYNLELIDLIGILEDEEYDELESKYGISEEEYFNPTLETIHKVQERLNSNIRHR